MRRLDLTIPAGPRPAYLRIAAAIRRAIKDGRARPGEPLPSTRDLAAETGVHRHTVMAALAELEAEGWVSVRARRAYYVNTDLPPALRAPPPKAAAATPHVWRLAREAPAARPEVVERYAFESGAPEVRSFPFKEFAGHLADVLRRPTPRLVGAGQTAGHAPLLVALSRFLRRTRGVTDRPLLITHGSQEALFLAAQLLAGPGDAVAVEALGYPPAWAAFRAAGARLEPCAVDAGGLDPEAFERLCRRTKLRFLYLTPLHQYPTTATLSVARRMRVYEVAVRYGVPIVEDDYDHEYHYRSQPLPPLAADDPAGLVVYISTFTKVLFPSLRIGYMALPPSLYEAALRMRRVTSSQNDALTQAALARWLEDGGFERHLRRMRRLYMERLVTLETSLARGVARGAQLAWQPPAGGMALWLELTGKGVKAAEAAAAAARVGVFVHPEELFQLRPSPARHLRLGFGALRPAEIEKGIALLLEAL